MCKPELLSQDTWQLVPSILLSPFFQLENSLRLPRCRSFINELASSADLRYTTRHGYVTVVYRLPRFPARYTVIIDTISTKESCRSLYSGLFVPASREEKQTLPSSPYRAKSTSGNLSIRNTLDRE